MICAGLCPFWKSKFKSRITKLVLWKVLPLTKVILCQAPLRLSNVEEEARKDIPLDMYLIL